MRPPPNCLRRTRYTPVCRSNFQRYISEYRAVVDSRVGTVFLCVLTETHDYCRSGYPTGTCATHAATVEAGDRPHWDTATFGVGDVVGAEDP